jgi:predicted dienelactone hydrolase
LVLDLDQPLDLSLWYPAEVNEGLEQPVVYSYEVKFTKPLGTMTVATFEGRAVTGAPMDDSAAPYPIIILSPGFSIRPEAYAWLTEHLASYGFVVISPDHNEQLDPEDQLWRSAIIRPQDIQAILAYLDQAVRDGGSLAGLIDLAKVAVVGHSYGGYTALAAAGARFDTDSFRQKCEGDQGTDEPGAWLCEKLTPHVEDMAELAGMEAVPQGLWPARQAERVDAIVPIAGDALFFGQPGLAEIRIPVMAIGGTADKDSPFDWGTRPTYEFASSDRKTLVGFIDAGHMIFTGPCERVPWHLKLFSGEFCSDRSWNRTYAHELTKHFVAAFLLAELNDDAAAAGEIARNYIEIIGIDYETVGYEMNE